MAVRQLTLLAAALIASAPSQAQESQIQNTVPMSMLYVSIPIGATTAKERTLTYGFALQGKRQYETVYLDSRMFNAFEGLVAGIEAKWVIAGGLVVGGAYAASRNRGGGSSNNNNNNNNGNTNPPPPCTDPCAKK